MKLITTLRAEILKTKRTASLYFALLGALPIPLIFLLNVVTGGGDLQAIGKDPLNSIFEMGAERAGVIFFPMFVIMVCTMLPQIEYRNNTWKQVFASPQTKSNVYLAKFLNINLLILLFLVANIVYMALTVVVIHFYDPKLNLLNQPFDAARLLLRTANTYVTVLAICAFQFWLGLRFRNFIIPTSIGFALWVTGMMLSFEFKSPMVDYFPYSFQTFPFITDFQPRMAQVALTSVGYAALILLLGFLDFRRRRLTA